MSKPIEITFNEMQLSGEAYDQPGSPLRAKVFICTAPRSGSYFFCRAMMHHRIGIPHEYFNAKHIGAIAKRAGIPSLANGAMLGSDAAARKAYCEALLARRTLDGIFAAKIHWGQYSDYLNNAEGDHLLQNGCFIHLNREDLLSRSHIVPYRMETGIWGVDLTVGHGPPHSRTTSTATRSTAT